MTDSEEYDSRQTSRLDSDRETHSNRQTPRLTDSARDGYNILYGDEDDLLPYQIGQVCTKDEKQMIMSRIDQRLVGVESYLKGKIKLTPDVLKWYRADMTKKVLREIANERYDEKPENVGSDNDRTYEYDKPDGTVSQRCDGLLSGLRQMAAIHLSEDGENYCKRMIFNDIKSASGRYTEMILDIISDMLTTDTFWKPCILAQDLRRYDYHLGDVLLWNESIMACLVMASSKSSQLDMNNKVHNNRQIIYNNRCNISQIADGASPANKSSVMDFIDDLCNMHKGTTTTKVLYNKYLDYCEDRDIGYVSKQMFVRTLKRNGLSRIRIGNDRGWTCSVEKGQ